VSPAASPRILIVDDDEGVIHTYSRMLRLEGYEVQTAGSAEMGLFEAELNCPDAIILDLHMPIIDGVELLRRIRSRDDRQVTPVAIMTGDFFLDDDVASEIKTLGARVAYKPLSLDDLVILTRNLLGAIH
jgi:DNA-binding response OmpR family regulator